MRNLPKYLIALLVFFMLALVPAVASAQAGEGAADGFGVEGIETGLVGLFPLVILISSFVLKPSAQEELKKFLPAAVGLIVSVIYFLVDTFPGFGQEVVINVALLIGLAMKLYDPLSALSKLLTAGRSLNVITGPGIIGAASTIEGD